MSDEEFKATLAEKLEQLYSYVNKRRFYELLGDLEAEKVRQLSDEAAKLAKELKLTGEEVEQMVDELDDYYVSGTSSRGEESPLDYWVEVVASRFKH
ncbi:MAG: hypothetical protein NXY59_06135 [Aigarchaeota archaeon]|nr:hypothetical protein [Candidatus Pelearchaeum maunauluense]